MEGRAIARPNTRRKSGAAVLIVASMEGRAIARPNWADIEAGTATAGASMEGRAIARPNHTSASSSTPSVAPLQWRAEQSLGQTEDEGRRRVWRRWCFNGGPSNRSAKLAHPSLGVGAVGASMEGRAIARPNRGRGLGPQPAADRLQWRAEQSLGQTTTIRNFDRSARSSLQWRAEQSLGQTRD